MSAATSTTRVQRITDVEADPTGDTTLHCFRPCWRPVPPPAELTELVMDGVVKRPVCDWIQIPGMIYEEIDEPSAP
jgi:hypothetical protein